MATFCRIPLLKPPTRRSACSAMPTTPRYRSTASRSAPPRMP